LDNKSNNVKIPNIRGTIAFTYKNKSIKMERLQPNSNGSLNLRFCFNNRQEQTDILNEIFEIEKKIIENKGQSTKPTRNYNWENNKIVTNSLIKYIHNNMDITHFDHLEQTINGNTYVYNIPRPNTTLTLIYKNKNIYIRLENPPHIIFTCWADESDILDSFHNELIEDLNIPSDNKFMSILNLDNCPTLVKNLLIWWDENVSYHCYLYLILPEKGRIKIPHGRIPFKFTYRNKTFYAERMDQDSNISTFHVWGNREDEHIWNEMLDELEQP
jgi:hypothetical protein